MEELLISRLTKIKSNRQVIMNISKTRELLRTGKTIYDLPLRVAYYARVSTDRDEQLNSLENQIMFFENYIKKNNLQEEEISFSYNLLEKLDAAEYIKVNDRKIEYGKYTKMD